MNAADRALIRRAQLARRFRRIRAGKHPYFRWGATSDWSVMSALIRRTQATMANYLFDEAKRDMQNMSNFRRLLRSGTIDFAPGPTIEWNFKVNGDKLEPIEKSS